MKRLCLVLPALLPCDTTMHVFQLMKGLGGAYEWTVLCTVSEGPLAPEARRLGAFIRTLEPRASWDPRLFLEVRRLFRRHRPDIVHTFLNGFDYCVLRAARSTGVPVAISSRRMLPESKSRRHLLLHRRANHYADGFVANCQAVAELTQRHEEADPRRFWVIHDGIETGEYAATSGAAAFRTRHGITEAQQVIGMVANFEGPADHGLFLRMARELVQKRPQVHFLLCGIGPKVKEVERMVRRWKLSGHVTRLGTVRERAALFGSMEAHVLCSRAESVPRACLEAMAAGVPVIAPAVGGIPEVIRDYERGRLIESRNPLVYAAAVADVLDHPPKAHVMVQRARQWVTRHHTADAMVQAHDQLYQRLLFADEAAP